MNTGIRRVGVGHERVFVYAVVWIISLQRLSTATFLALRGTRDVDGCDVSGVCVVVLTRVHGGGRRGRSVELAGRRQLCDAVVSECVHLSALTLPQNSFLAVRLHLIFTFRSDSSIAEKQHQKNMEVNIYFIAERMNERKNE